MSNNLVRHSLLTATIAGSALVFTGTLFVSPAPALSGTASDNLNVSASVVNACTISTTALDFGNYDPLIANKSTPQYGTGSVKTTCTTGANTIITLDQGLNPADSSSDENPLRRLTGGTGGAGALLYVLYQDSGHSTEWGNTSGTGLLVTGTGVEQSSTVYGYIVPGQEDAPTGSYVDTVVAKVTF